MFQSIIKREIRKKDNVMVVRWRQINVQKSLRVQKFFGNLNLLLCFTFLVAAAVAKGSNHDGNENGKKAIC